MQSIEFPPIGRTTSRIGLGCGRLLGRARLRESARLVETALDLGIRYFDVAPSYGMGTAEEVLGEVIGDSRDAVIATKVGIPRPAYSAQSGLLRKYLKPMLDRSRSIKSFARTLYVRSKAAPAERPRFDFTDAAIRASLAESLAKLRRASVDVLLAHEPHIEDLSEEVERRFASLIGDGLVSAIGAGVDRRGDRPRRFGSIWQSGWPGDGFASYGRDAFHVFHGVIRYAEKNRLGATIESPNALLRSAMTQAPNAIFLVSASTPERLRELLEGV